VNWLAGYETTSQQVRTSANFVDVTYVLVIHCDILASLRQARKGLQDMPNTLQIANELTVTPLIDIHNIAFARHYRDGLCWSLSGDYRGDKPPLDTHLVANLKQDAAKGYYVGRRDCFRDTPSNERIYTDSKLLEELCQIAQDVMGYPNEENPWYYSIGCLLGNMSTQVFPATPEECQRWEAEYRHWQEEYERELAKARGS
jgi:hypothetical protein